MRPIMLIALLSAEISICSAADNPGGGFAVQAGIMNLYGGGLGAAIEYQFLLKSAFRITPYAAAGIMGSSGSEEMMRGFGYAGGCFAEFGKRHRFICGGGFGTHGVAYTTDSVTKRETRLNDILGPAAYIGYKGAAKSGIFWQICGGIMNGTEGSERFTAPAAGLGVGYKF